MPRSRVQVVRSLLFWNVTQRSCSQLCYSSRNRVGSPCVLYYASVSRKSFVSITMGIRFGALCEMTVVTYLLDRLEPKVNSFDVLSA